MLHVCAAAEHVRHVDAPCGRLWTHSQLLLLGLHNIKQLCVVPLPTCIVNSTLCPAEQREAAEVV